MTLASWLMTALSARDVLGSIPKPVKLNPESPTARHRCDVSVLSRRYAAEMGPTTRYTCRRNTASMMKIRFEK